MTDHRPAVRSARIAPGLRAATRSPAARRTAARGARDAFAVLLAAVCGLGLFAPGASAQSSSASTTWLCRPDRVPNPCTADRSFLTPDGTRPSPTGPRTRPTLDCFYVYPTVSSQPTGNANLLVEDAQRGVAQAQASRYSQSCRVWAPMYRQVTLAGITGRAQGDAELAYRDVRAAWREYRRRSGDRGVVLVGHSQGTFMLRRLLREEIAPKRSARASLVAAHLIGGDAQEGEARGVRPCRSATQVGCVVAYSAYDGPVPPSSLFGRSSIRFFADAHEPRRGLRTICTNPASLRGGSGPLGVFLRRTGEAAPWRLFDGFTGQCVRENGATVLRVTLPVDSVVPAGNGSVWGLHTFDVNLALGNLVPLAAQQGAAWRRARAEA